MMAEERMQNKIYCNQKKITAKFEMKSIKEIQEMLVSDLCLNLTNIDTDQSPDYYNDVLGDSSFLLAALLEQLLLEEVDNWDSQKWIDDSLITKVNFVENENKISIWGAMIWGTEDTTEQWTDPFYFEIVLTQRFSDYEQYSFLFEDQNNPGITYGYFKNNRDYWDRRYYLSDKWDIADRAWRYVIHVKNKV